MLMSTSKLNWTTGPNSCTPFWPYFDLCWPQTFHLKISNVKFSCLCYMLFSNTWLSRVRHAPGYAIPYTSCQLVTLWPWTTTYVLVCGQPSTYVD